MAKFSAARFIKDQYSHVPYPPKQNLTGKTIIVIGANGGLGFEASKQLAAMNPGKFILACRSVQKGEEALTEIRKSTGCKTMSVWQIDLASFASVKAFADRFEREGGGRLDLLLLNAAVELPVFQQTKDGWETALQVNHLSLVLLGLLLLPSMVTTPVNGPFPRISIVSSDLHFTVKMDKEAAADHILEYMNDQANCPPPVMRARYPTSKLFNIWVVKELVARLPKDTNITVNSVAPGFCHSGLTRNFTGAQAVSVRILKALLARSTVAGSRNLVYASIAGTQKEMQGSYIATCRIQEEGDVAISPEGKQLGQRLWRETMEILEDVEPGVKQIANRHLTRT